MEKALDLQAGCRQGKRGLFYPRMALSNLKKNGAFTFPFLLTCICSAVVFYLICTLSGMQSLDQVSGGWQLRSILSMGTVVLGLMSGVFLLYTNSFLIKRRNKELALYSILGMEKKHIAAVLALETLYLFLGSLILSLLVGSILGKLMFLLLLNLTQMPISLEFTLSPVAIFITTVWFLVVFSIILISNLFRVQVSSPMQLLNRQKQGEKEPRASWLITLAGLLSLGGGYYLALSVKGASDALLLFFPAVLLVIVGTYCLFTSGSIALLKLLKKNKKFYYKSKNFISLSGMIYRMKQNAAGLASICILSTMVLVTLSSTTALYAGQKDSLQQFYPQDLTLVLSDGLSQEKAAALDKLLLEAAREKGVQVKDGYSYYSQRISAVRQGGSFSSYSRQDLENADIAAATCGIRFLSLEDYNQMTGESRTLSAKELLVFSNRADYGLPSVTLAGQEYRVRDELEKIPMVHQKLPYGGAMDDLYYMVLPDWNAIEQAVTAFHNPEMTTSKSYLLACNLEGDDEAILSLAGALAERDGIQVSSLHQSKSDFYSLYGGLLFMGIFFGVVFISATVLIIYYKQISEGYEDRERFHILQKVGMDQNMVRGTIRRQILTVFFLPLACAIVHMIFAEGIIPKVLVSFNMTNIGLTLACTGATILIFAIFYTAVYLLTARTYYKIVH